MKVLDVCLALAGPTCDRLLQEFGADVIKISPPRQGAGGYLNRGKRSLLLDLNMSQGQEVFLRLAERTDVIVENFSPGTADRLGIGYPEVRARKPDIIYTSISCYGFGGPSSHGRGWERQGQAVSGVMHIADLALNIKAQCYSIEAANVRHEHEYRVWEDVKLPEGKILMPGVLSHATDLVEHPELIAERIVRYAERVGREHVQTGTDCGIGSRVGHEEIVWAKLEAMAEGARIASERLWK